MAVRTFHIEQLKGIPVNNLEIEIVERKGKGHPDSLIDGAAEAVSRSLCRYYLDEFGVILHHNVDKGLLVGGRSEARFGGGEVLDPIYMIIAGRATNSLLRGGQTKEVPVGDLAIRAIKDFVRSTMRFLDPEKHVIVDQKIKPGSFDLVSIFQKSGNIPLANDTSIGVGFAPLTPTEKLVLDCERLLNSPALKKELPEIAEDVKVMALRRNNKVSLTIAASAIASLTPDRDHYLNVVHEVADRVKDLAAHSTDMSVEVSVNAGDNVEKGVYYLTVTGTSAESGDDGNTGRGNRPNGLITPMRQYSMEATAGKNPVNHTGKLFNVLAQRAADRIYSEVNGIREVYVRLLSRIGDPIDHPQIASAGVISQELNRMSSVSSEIESILNDELKNITQLTAMILRDEVTLF